MIKMYCIRSEKRLQSIVGRWWSVWWKKISRKLSNIATSKLIWFLEFHSTDTVRTACCKLAGFVLAFLLFNCHLKWSNPAKVFGRLIMLTRQYNMWPKDTLFLWIIILNPKRAHFVHFCLIFGRDCRSVGNGGNSIAAIISRHMREKCFLLEPRPQIWMILPSLIDTSEFTFFVAWAVTWL